MREARGLLTHSRKDFSYATSPAMDVAEKRKKHGKKSRKNPVLLISLTLYFRLIN
jgi:hypothetical protein